MGLYVLMVLECLVLGVEDEHGDRGWIFECEIFLIYIVLMMFGLILLNT